MGVCGGVLGGQKRTSPGWRSCLGWPAQRLGSSLNLWRQLTERRTLDKLLSIMDNVSHPLHTVIYSQRSLISQRMLLPKCRTRADSHTLIIYWFHSGTVAIL